ncbi:major facilitator superfamily multidrug-resistance, DHA1 sub-family [Mycena vulgaris]|nr:major facilitator superfamily multidrug-resistance, DHA1 sub-family [Mycena vulgaris]
MDDSETPREDSNGHVAKKRTPIPKLQLSIVLCTRDAHNVRLALVIYPFVIQFVRDTGITGGEETKTGFYAGILESAFFMAESLTALQFGRLSDFYGRRPVLLLGPLGLTIAMLGFGLSKSFWSLFFFRCIQGACNGNIGVTKTVINEIADPTNIADIFSMMPIVWSIGSTMGPLIGGMLANPAARWPATLGKIGILREHPYASFCGLNTQIYLLQTLPSIVARRPKSTHSPAETDPLLPAAPPELPAAPPPIRDLFIRPVLIAIANHGLLAFCGMSHDALLPLFLATPISLGGLGLKPYDIGLILGLCGICNAFVQIFIGGRIIRRFGPRRIFIAGFCAICAQFTMYPLLGFLARRAGRVDAAVRIVLACQLSGVFMVSFAYASTYMFIMDAAPSPASLGGLNGLAQMVGTVLRSVAPSFASSLFSLSAEHHIAGGNMVYIVLFAATLGAVRCSMLLPRKLRFESKDKP